MAVTKVSSELKVVSDATSFTTNDTISSIKSSMLFQGIWETLLMSAPHAVSSLGTCTIASSTEYGADVQLNPPEGGFKLLNKASLKANLTDCVNLGRLAFKQADSSMSAIRSATQGTDDTFAAITRTLVVPDGKVSNLVVYHLDDLKDTADNCLQSSLETDKAFEAWLAFVLDMHSTCESQASSTRTNLLSTKFNLFAEQTRLDYLKLEVGSANDAIEALKAERGTASRAFQKASDEFPDGWDLVGQQFVSGLADTVHQVVSKAIPVLMASCSPKGKFEYLTGDATGFAGGLPKGNEGSSSDGSSRPPLDAQPAQQSTQSGTPFMNDPAYSQVNKDMILFDIMRDLLTGGSDSGVNWDKAKGNNNSAKNPSSFLKSMFDDSKQTFNKLATANEPSVAYCGVLNDMSEIATQLNDQVLQGGTADYVWPKNNDPLVISWQDTFNKAYLQACSIYSTAKSMPGNPPNGYQMVSSQAVDPSSISADSSQAQVVLDAAAFKLNAAQQAYLATQANYQTSAEMLSQQQVRMGEIEANFTKAQGSTSNLETTLQVLRGSLSLIINMKSDISNMVLFFRSLSTFIDGIVTGDVKRLIRHLNPNSGDDDDDDDDAAAANMVKPDAKVGQFTFADAEREFIYRTTLIIRGYFSLYAEIANMWVELSVNSIAPGLELVEKLGRVKDDRVQMEPRLQELNEYIQLASDAIASRAGKASKDMNNQVDARIMQITSAIQQLSAPATIPTGTEGPGSSAATDDSVNKIQDALKVGTAKVKDAAKLSLERRRALLG